MKWWSRFLESKCTCGVLSMAKAKAGPPYRALRTRGTGTDRQYRALHAASQGNHRSRKAAVLLPVGRWLRRFAGKRRSSRVQPRQLPRHCSRRQPRTDDLERTRRRFDMVLSGQVPAAIHDTLNAGIGIALGNKSVAEIDLWAVHPGGKSVLDAVERAL